jgi:hypothetical protein
MYENMIRVCSKPVAGSSVVTVNSSGYIPDDFFPHTTIDDIDEENVAKAAKYLDSISAIKMSEGEPCNIKKVKDGVFKL